MRLADIDFRILGPLEIRQNGLPLRCTGAKQRLLLAALLLHANEVISSDRLIDALWGEHPPPTAAKALQVHVSQLRRLLEPERSSGSLGDLLLTRPPGYELHVGKAAIDLNNFEAGVAAARVASAAGHVDEASSLLTDALALWRGPPLADLSFEEFLQPEIARLEELRLTAVEDRIEADLALGRHLETAGEIEAVAAANPLRERIQGLLMLALYRSGRQADALQVYRDTRRRLVDELGLEPGRELKELEGRILTQDQSLDGPARGDHRADDAMGLVGRERELAELSAMLDAVVAGRGAMALIGGEPGIGKSRLAEVLARKAERRHVRIAVGRCWEAGGAPPFWPWVQALRVLLGATEADALPDLLGEQVQLDDSQGARFRMFESIAALLRETAAAAPVALFLDDIHAADAPSLLLLRFVAAQLADTPILVVGCYRDTEVEAELGEALAELARAPSVHRLALKGLDAAATGELLEATMHEPAPEELAERVQAETHGNPLFAAELGRLFASEGIPADGGGRLPVPEGVREAIRRRLERQSAACRSTLALASVLGREFDLAAVAAVSDLSEPELWGAIEEAAAARLVDAVPGTGERVRFSHMLVRDALYEDMPAPKRLLLHLTVARALETLDTRDRTARLTELAHHYLAAGGAGAAKAIEYAERAGESAAIQHGYEESARWYSTAVELLEASAAPDADRSCRVLLALGDVLSRAGNASEAKDALRRAAHVAQDQGWPDRLATAALAYGGRFAWARASTDPALVPLLEQALAAVGSDDDAARARLLARLAAATRDDAERARRVALAQEAVTLARRADDPTTLAYVLEGSWPALETQDPTDGIRIGAELIALSAQIGDPERAFLGHDFRLHGFWAFADRAGVDVEIDALARLADELAQPGHRWHVHSHRAMVALLEGRFGDAERLIGETRAMGQRAEAFNAVVSERLQLFVLRHAQGRVAELAPSLERSVHEYPALLRFPCALAHTYAAAGDERRARSALGELLAHDLAHHHVDAEWLFALSLLPDACRALADADAAATLYPVLLPYSHLYAEAPVEVSFGTTARALGVLATTLGEFADAEHHFEAAMEMERRMGAWPWIAHVSHDLAAMLLARGTTADRARASRLLAEATTRYVQLGMESWAERALALT